MVDAETLILPFSISILINFIIILVFYYNEYKNKKL